MCVIELVTACTDGTQCANPALTSQPGHVAGTCQSSNPASYTCMCANGYEYDSDQDICKGICNIEKASQLLYALGFMHGAALQVF